MLKVKYNNQIYSCYSLWEALKKDGIITDFYRAVEIWVGQSPDQIVKEEEADEMMAALAEVVKADPDAYDADDETEIFFGDYYAVHIVFDGKTYTFDYESINDPTYSGSTEHEIEYFLTHEINAKIPDCCETEYEY